YQYRRGLQEVKEAGGVSRSIAGFMRKTSLIPVISDFLFDNPREILQELSLLDSTHDVFLVLIDSAFAFEFPRLSAGWIEAFDIETGRSRIMSRGSAARLAARTREWQDDIERMAKNADL